MIVLVSTLVHAVVGTSVCTLLKTIVSNRVDIIAHILCEDSEYSCSAPVTTIVSTFVYTLLSNLVNAILHTLWRL